MILPEDVAIKKWCPFARMGDAAHNRFLMYEGDFLVSASRAGCNCIASRCMFWRSAGTRHYDRNGAQIRPIGGSIEKPVGYCGVAGKPESTL